MIFELCKGRHEMPNNPMPIFQKELNPLDLQGMKAQAKNVLEPYKNGSISVYVTGLTVALVEVIKICKENNISLTLLHYDRDSGTYYEQNV